MISVHLVTQKPKIARRYLLGVLQCDGVSTIYVAVCCSVVRCVPVYCSVLQCVAVCCSVGTLCESLQICPCVWGRKREGKREKKRRSRYGV